MALFFFLVFSFINEDWIFTNEIIIDCDGQQFTLEVDFSKLETEILWGDIWETTVFTDAAVNDLGISGNEIVDFEPIVSAMTTASKVTVRFRGDGGKKDVNIPASHIEQLSGFWTTYQILLDNPSLVSVLM